MVELKSTAGAHILICNVALSVHAAASALAEGLVPSHQDMQTGAAQIHTLKQYVTATSVSTTLSWR